jgi:hypothetical protein
VDLDKDGRSDILSGSWPGEIYFFRRKPDGKFAAGIQLEGKDGKALNVGSASSAFAVDWDGNGTMDLLVGNVLGEIYFIPNEGRQQEFRFGTPVKLQAQGKNIQLDGDAAPVAADWDGDGLLDLLVGSAQGRVVWYRNVGRPGQPRLEAARTLIGPSAIGWGDDAQRRPGEWGLRAKVCVVDWNGDGRLDLLVGDRCGNYQGKANQSDAELKEERSARDRLPGLRRKWATAFREYNAARSGTQPNADSVVKLRAELVRLKDEIASVEKIQEHYLPGHQSHGFVWLFQRKALDPPVRPNTKGR